MRKKFDRQGKVVHDLYNVFSFIAILHANDLNAPCIVVSTLFLIMVVRGMAATNNEEATILHL